MNNPQNMVALDLANERRRARSKLYHQIRDDGEFAASCIAIAELLADTPPLCVGGMRAEELLQWIYCHGGNQPHRKRRLVAEALAAAGCSEFKLVRDLTPRQRTLIVDVLTSEAYGRQAA